MFWYICICVLTKLAERCLEFVPLQRFCEDYHRWFGRRSWLLPKTETDFTQLFTCGSWLEFTQSLFLLTSHPDLPHPPTSPHLTPTALAVVLSLFFPSHFSQCLTRGFCFVCFLMVIIWLFSAYRHDRRHRSSITLRSSSMHSDRVGRRTQWTYSIVSFAIPVVGVLIPNGFDAVLCPSVFNWAQHTSVCWFVWLELF